MRWYVGSVGGVDALHTAHWHGIVLNNKGHHVDQVVVQGGALHVMDAYTDNPGTWLFHCHLADHMDGGMMALFTISGEDKREQLDGKVWRQTPCIKLYCIIH